MAEKSAPNWHRAKALHEQGKSFATICTETQIPLRTLKYRAKNEKWKKGILAPRLHQREQAGLEREAERHGVTKAKVFAKVAELMDAEKTELYRGTPVCNTTDNSARLGATNLAADLLGMKKQTETPDLAQSILAWVRSQT